VRLLLDTHTFLWLLSAPEKLSPKALAACRARENALFMSVVNVWEIQIKRQLDKLAFDLVLKDVLDEWQATNDVGMLPVELRHVLALDDLPRYHSDPFDRLLVAQAIVEGMHLVSKDSRIHEYPVPVCW
jgi:PIN domain nuclease of toxin-antitoxin system